MGSKKRKRVRGNPAAPHASQRPKAGVAGGPPDASRPLPADPASAPSVFEVSRASRAKKTQAPDAVSSRPQPGFFDLAVDERQGYENWTPSVLEDAPPHGVASTYRFRAPSGGGTYSMAVRFVGKREGVDGDPTSGDRFERLERLEGFPADGGEVALTTRALNLNPGSWRVTAQPETGPESALPSHVPRYVIETHTIFSRLAQGPAVRLWAWPGLVLVGALLAIVLQSTLALDAGLNAPAVLALSVMGCLLGVAGARVWHLALNRQPLTQFMSAGACIQGFLVTAIAVLAGGSALLGMPVTTVLDVSAPGILLGMAVGRPGCFLTGCCAGRPTASRFGLVSSDRRVLVRRVPVQLIEAASALVLGVLGLALLLGPFRATPGVTFLGSFAAYTLIRQVLFPLRVGSRTRKGRVATIVVCSLLLAFSLVVSFLG